MAGLGRPGPGPRAAMPAWKREILERRRAKLAALSGGAAPGAGPGAEPAPPEDEKLVLAESLGPLRENLFMRLESERRRGAVRGGGVGPAGARPVQQLLELYSRVPGVRTIRADNILIIESASDFDPAPGSAAAARIRAAEVVVYEAPPPPGRVSRLLQKFDPPAAPRRRGSPERRRGSPERGRPPPPSSSPAAPREGERASAPEPDLRAVRGLGARRSDFLQKTGSNSFTVHPRGLHQGVAARQLPNGHSALEPQATAANGLRGSGPESPGLGEWKPKVEPPLHPPPSPGTPSATPAVPTAFSNPSPPSATPSQRQWVSAATSANDSFEIRPAPKPDLNAIPIGDIQARALASLRVNSRNSFLLVPKRKTSGIPPEGRPTLGLPEVERSWTSERLERKTQASGSDGSLAHGRNPLEVEEGGCPRPATALVDQAVKWHRASSPPPSPRTPTEAQPAQGFRAPALLKNGGELGRPGLPVTFIDEVDSEDEAPQEAKLPSGATVLPQYHLHPPRPRHSSELQHRGGNTFVVVPKKRPGALQTNGEPGPQETKPEETGSLLEPTATPGAELKKRYPTVNEIEVIGGYLALQKSCLTKPSSSRKKMKISFNDQSLQTTFEYPSESSLVQEVEEEEQEEEEEEEEEEDEEDGAVTSFKLFLPRATFINNVGPESPRLPEGSSCLSSYTPKHAMAFSKWQEQTPAPVPSEEEPPPKDVMLTPASQSDLSDFRSEPALYF